MIRKINKKMVFGLSLVLSSVFSFSFFTSKKTNIDLISLLAETSITSIQRAQAEDGDGCCGSSSGISVGPWTPTTGIEAVSIRVKEYTQPADVADWNSYSTSSSASGGGYSDWGIQGGCGE